MQSRLVIRSYAPLRRYLLVGAAVLLAPLCVYLAFELGRFRAGYDVRAALAARGELKDQIHALESREREQRVQLAALESAKIGQTRERSEVSRSIGELQAQVARQAQDLAFYRGIVGESGQSPVKIQQFRVVAGGAPLHFTLKLVLGRPVRPEDVISGVVAITLEGSQGLVPASRDLSQLTAGKKHELEFNFRYLQPIDVEIEIPSGFKPERVTVELRAGRKGAEPLRQSYLWSPEPA
jgi:hypothetical protein